MMVGSVHLDDSDMENGSLYVIQGSLKKRLLPHVGKYYLDHHEYPLSIGTPCPTKSGDVLFFNYDSLLRRQHHAFLGTSV